MDFIEQQLSSFGIEKSKLIAISVGEPTTKAYAFEVNQSNRYVLWEHFNSIKSQTGFSPLVTAFWNSSVGSWTDAIEKEGLFDRFPFEHEDSTLEITPKAIIERAKTADYSKILSEHNSIYSEDLVDHMQFSLESLSEQFKKSPSEEELLQLMKDKKIKDYFGFEEWLLNWQLAELTGHFQDEESDAYLDWFEPQDQHEALILLPTQHSYDALAFMHWFGAENSSTEESIAMLRHWNQTYGAELVAHYGTMLHLKVGNRPQTVKEAFSLAKEQESFAPCTTALPGATLRDLAYSLNRKDSWFLHERP